jgi:hypothetical protein
VTVYTPVTIMTFPDLFTPDPPKQTDPTHGVVELQGDHYAVTCAACGAGKQTPSDVGRSTAECTLRYAGWQRGPDKRWRCRWCLKQGETSPDRLDPAR